MKIWFVIILMAVVTYLPRFMPLHLLKDRPLHPLLRRLLSFIPYAALGALIFPGVFSAIPRLPAAGIAGIAAAVCVAWFKGGLVLSVVASVGIAFLILFIGS